MLRTRVIPVLLLMDGGLVKTIRFRDPRYVGDPINAVRIFNEKEVDELILLNISRTTRNTGIPVREITDIASEAFMPMGFGGGIRTMNDLYAVFQSGFEKAILNTIACENTALVREAVREAGGQSIVVCIDVKKNLFGKYQVFADCGRKSTGLDLPTYVKHLEDIGVGEIIINSIDRDGTLSGYDNQLISAVARAVNIPVVASGGARGVNDFVLAVQHGASGVSAGSCFVFYGKHRAVLISYPEYATLESALNDI
jgi:cyclase